MDLELDLDRENAWSTATAMLSCVAKFADTVAVLSNAHDDAYFLNRLADRQWQSSCVDGVETTQCVRYIDGQPHQYVAQVSDSTIRLSVEVVGSADELKAEWVINRVDDNIVFPTGSTSPESPDFRTPQTVLVDMFSRAVTDYAAIVGVYEYPEVTALLLNTFECIYSRTYKYLTNAVNEENPLLVGVRDYVGQDGGIRYRKVSPVPYGFNLEFWLEQDIDKVAVLIDDAGQAVILDRDTLARLYRQDRSVGRIQENYLILDLLKNFGILEAII